MNLFGFCLFALSSVSAQSGLALFKVEPGATVNALGGAAVALPDDPAALGANPALAAQMSQPGVSFGYNTYWSAVNLTDLHVAPRFSSSVRGLFAVRYAGLDQIEKRTGATSEPDATFGLNDVLVRGGLATRIGDKFSVGATVGFVFEKIDLWRGSAMSIDLGMTYQLTQTLLLGVAATQLGSDFALTAPAQQSSDMIAQPTTLRVGGSFQKGDILATSELAIDDENSIVKLGAGYQLVPEFALRAGYRIGDDSRSLSGGFLAQYDQFSLAYSVVPYQNSLGTAHLVSLGISW